MTSHTYMSQIFLSLLMTFLLVHGHDETPTCEDSSPNCGEIMQRKQLTKDVFCERHWPRNHCKHFCGICDAIDGGCISVIGGRDDKEGTVIHTKRGKSRILCGQYFDTNSAAIVCRKIGHRAGVAMSTKNNYFNIPENFINITSFYYFCPSQKLSECSRYPATDTKLCTYPFYVSGLICDFELESVELVGGSAVNNGTLVYTYDGQPGVFVDQFDRWTENYTTVACRMLGYSGGESFFRGKYDGPANNQIFIVGCSGTESTLTECENYGLHAGDVIPYYQSKIVGVVCTA